MPIVKVVTDESSNERSGRTSKKDRLKRKQNPSFLQTEAGIGPVLLENETEAQRRRRLAARKAKTLKAFQMAYESHRQRKTS